MLTEDVEPEEVLKDCNKHKVFWRQLYKQRPQGKRHSRKP
jgi:hypothetical protein